MVVIQQPEEKKWLLFKNPIDILSTTRVGQVKDIFNQVSEYVNQQGKYAAGSISYEAAPAFDEHFPVKASEEFPLVWFGIYEQPEELIFPNETELEIKNKDLDWKLVLDEVDYQRCLKKIKTYIKNGDTYQVNYSFRLKSEFKNNPWDLFVQMVRAQNLSHQPGYSAFINSNDWSICSASPELFFRQDGNNLISKPMKGTASRGSSFEDDLLAGKALRDSEKNCAENIMIADMVRNDMGRIADIGSVLTTNILAKANG